MSLFRAVAQWVYAEEIQNATEMLTDAELEVLEKELDSFKWKDLPIVDANDHFKSACVNVASALRWAGLLPTTGEEEWLPERYEWLLEHGKCKPVKPKEKIEVLDV